MSNLVKVGDQLEGMISRNLTAIPKGVNHDRLRLNAIMYINQDEKVKAVALQQPARVAQILFNFIILGLDVFNKEAYIIPFGKELQVIRDYKGEAKLAKMYSVEPIKNITARVVYEGDKYSFDIDDNFKHEFDPFTSKKDKKMIGAYCTISYKNGDKMTEFINEDEINKIKAFSKSSSSQYSPWNTWEESMWKKSVIRKALKLVPLDFGAPELNKAYTETDNDVDFTKPIQEVEIIEQPDPFADIPEVEPAPAEPTGKTSLDDF